MKKLPKYLSHIAFSMLVWGAFLLPSIASAYTTAHAQNTDYLNHSPLPSNATFIASFDPSYFTATGTSQSFITYLLWANTGTATSGAPFFFQLYRFSTGTYLDCQTQTYTPTTLGVNPVSAGWGQGSFRAMVLTGTACDMSANFTGDYGLREQYPTSPGQPVVYLPYVDWWRLTTDPSTSVIYEYQDTAIGISTTTTATYCNATYSGLSLGSDIANAMCNVIGFLFIPDSGTLNQFGSLSDVVQTKIPFSYYFGVKGVYDNLSASSTENLPTYGITLPDISSSTPLGSIIPTHIDFFSTTTISKYYPDAIRESMLTLGSFAIWVTLAITLYRRIVPHKTL